MFFPPSSFFFSPFAFQLIKMPIQADNRGADHHNREAFAVITPGKRENFAR